MLSHRLRRAAAEAEPEPAPAADIWDITNQWGLSPPYWTLDATSRIATNGDITGNDSAIKGITTYGTGKMYIEFSFNDVSDTFKVGAGFSQPNWDAYQAGILGTTNSGNLSLGFLPLLDGGWTYIRFNNAYKVTTNALTAGIDDIVMQAIDFTTGKYWFGVNGVWYNGGDPGAGTGETFQDNLLINLDMLLTVAGREAGRVVTIQPTATWLPLGFTLWG